MGYWFENNPIKAVFLFILLFTVLADLICGHIFIPPSCQIPHPYYHHDIRPGNFKGRLTWGGKYYNINTNSLGFKDKENRKIALVTDRHRIVFIGDSFTEGVGFPYEETFVGIIDDEMKKWGVEVLNAAATGYCPKLYYLKMKYFIEVVGLRFDELFVYVDLSDIVDEVYYKDYLPYVTSAYKRILHTAHRWVLRNSLIYNFLYYTAFPRLNFSDLINKASGLRVFERMYKWETYREAFQKYGKEGFPLTELNMNNLFELCRKNGIKMTVAIYPNPEQIISGKLESKYVIFWRDFCKNNGIGFLNYYPDFIDGSDPYKVIVKYYIHGDKHFNANGHVLISRKWLEHCGSKYKNSEK